VSGKVARFARDPAGAETGRFIFTPHHPHPASDFDRRRGCGGGDSVVGRRRV